MKRPVRTGGELEGVREHLEYEMRMVRGLSQCLSASFDSVVLHDAALESFAIHARLLLHFFFPQNEQRDDVLAEDFLVGWDWAATRGSMPSALADIRKRVAKEVAHLSYARLDVTPEAKGWPVHEIARALDTLHGRFEYALVKTKREREGGADHPEDVP